MPAAPYEIKKTRQRIGFSPPRGSPYYSGKCKLKRVGTKIGADRCDLKCKHLRVLSPLDYDCLIGMMVKMPIKVREKEWS